MRALLAILLSLWLGLAAAGAEEPESVLVVAHCSVPADSISGVRLLDLYTRDIQAWSDDRPVVLLDQKERGPVREAFYRFLGKSPSRMKSIWMKKMLSGEGEPPQSFRSEEDSIRKMATITEEVDRINTSWLPRAIAISEVNLSTAELRTRQLQHALARTEERKQAQADLHEGIESTLTLLHHILKNRIEIVRQYGDIPPINCYPNQLNQVFMNLLANAAQAIEGEGRITIRTERRGEKVRIAVADTGIGIPPEHLSRIFDPGFTSKGVGVGTGLGLSISYRIVHGHHGRFEVDSRVGEGTEMTVVLPVDLENPED